MKYSNKTFADRSEDLDGNEYLNCSFERCKLMYCGGPIPRFDTCAFNASSFMFEKGAGNALEFLRELYHAGLNQNVEALFADIRANPPGSGRA